MLEHCFEIKVPSEKTGLFFCAETVEEMASWINALVQASFLGGPRDTIGTGDPVAKEYQNSNANKSLVYSVKGMMCPEHIQCVKGIVTDTHGVNKFEMDTENEYIFVKGTFDELILRNNIERVGFLLYDEPDIPSTL